VKDAAQEVADFVDALYAQDGPPCRLECLDVASWCGEPYYGTRDGRKAFERAGFLACSRLQGHAGPHVACGTDMHARAVWWDKE
jgi:hypothetical protein